MFEYFGYVKGVSYQNPDVWNVEGRNGYIPIRGHNSTLQAIPFLCYSRFSLIAPDSISSPFPVSWIELTTIWWKVTGSSAQSFRRSKPRRMADIHLTVHTFSKPRISACSHFLQNTLLQKHKNFYCRLYACFTEWEPLRFGMLLVVNHKHVNSLRWNNERLWYWCVLNPATMDWFRTLQVLK
jgi:hypothetical protein